MTGVPLRINAYGWSVSTKRSVLAHASLTLFFWYLSMFLFCLFRFPSAWNQIKIHDGFRGFRWQSCPSRQKEEGKGTQQSFNIVLNTRYARVGMFFMKSVVTRPLSFTRGPHLFCQFRTQVCVQQCSPSAHCVCSSEQRVPAASSPSFFFFSRHIFKPFFLPPQPLPHKRTWSRE